MVTATTVEGVSVADSDSTTYHNAMNFSLLMTFGPARPEAQNTLSTTIVGTPGAIVETSMTIDNRGDYAVTSIDNFTLISKTRVDTSTTETTIGTIDTSDCEAAMNTLIQNSDFRLEPGTTETVPCSVLMPDTLSAEGDRPGTAYLEANISYSSSEPEVVGYSETRTRANLRQ